jgi:hypothetical protein
VPALEELPAALADPRRRDLELLAQVQGPFVACQRPDQAALAAGQRAQPGGEVDAELLT